MYLRSNCTKGFTTIGSLLVARTSTTLIDYFRFTPPGKHNPHT